MSLTPIATKHLGQPLKKSERAWHEKIQAYRRHYHLPEDGFVPQPRSFSLRDAVRNYPYPPAPEALRKANRKNPSKTYTGRIHHYSRILKREMRSDIFQFNHITANKIFRNFVNSLGEADFRKRLPVYNVWFNPTNNEVFKATFLNLEEALPELKKALLEQQKTLQALPDRQVNRRRLKVIERDLTKLQMVQLTINSKKNQATPSQNPFQNALYNPTETSQPNLGGGIA